VATEIKFCGLTRAADAAAAVELGAAYVGVIFAGGPRLVTPTAAGELLTPAGGRARRVGVFGPGRAEEIAAAAVRVPVDVVQLHGDPDAALVEQVRAASGKPVWAALRIEGGRIPPGAGALFRTADAVVFDAKVAGRLGGTGVPLDWAGLREPLSGVRGNTALVLAGGLTPENVSEAVDVLAPDVVDVSSGVESAPGVKDHARMRAFADAVRMCGAGSR
jgi:phosphoribosylanthranilate isomerase